MLAQRGHVARQLQELLAADAPAPVSTVPKMRSWARRQISVSAEMLRRGNNFEESACHVTDGLALALGVGGGVSVGIEGSKEWWYG